MKKNLLFAFFLALSLVITACSSKRVDPDDPDAVEITAKDGETVDTPEQELFEKATDYYNRELYTSAKEQFETLRNSYPFGTYAELASVKIADSDFFNEKYDNAAISYNNVLNRYPASTSTPYSLLQLGRSYQLSYRGAGKDIYPIIQALKYYERLIREYPYTSYSKSAKEYARKCGEVLAKHEESIMNFYERTGRTEAYKVRKDAFESKWKPLLESIERLDG